MVEIDKSKPVMVTGATGYVAGWIVKKLLDEGLTVHAAVRNPNNEEKIKYLKLLAASSKGQIKFFKADLLEKSSYDDAVKNCELVFHTASPFSNRVKDPQKELIDPALEGTRNVLDSVNKSETVKRVVLTSSVAAIMGDTKDLLDIPNRIATEENWNISSSLTHQPYSYSKTLAEKEAWNINEKQNKWDLVVINPTLVLGPGISPAITSESYKLMQQLGDGSMKMGVPDFQIGVVDVRDVAEAHYKAGFTPEAKGRHIVNAESKTFLQIADLVRKNYGDKVILQTKTLPKWVVWLAAPTAGLKRKFVTKNVGYPWTVDNRKSIEKLGIEYRPLEVTVNDFFEQMIDNGAFEKA
ncbi:MAG: diaminohydroxyphosphoribosylaminopyrimidine deaminase [Marinilabiliales bacterium]|nr:MAG: diaminohydroxyphosphoribosylaminopyrimidine deaminase [Marinilabiliales bacterium]